MYSSSFLSSSACGMGKMKCSIFVIIWFLSACAIFVPLVFPEMQQRMSKFSHTGCFGKTLRTSVVIKIFEGVNVGSALPQLVNVCLDKISYPSNKSELGSHYWSLLVMFATGVVYLSFYEEDFIAYFYASSFCVKLQTVCSVVMYSVSNGVVATQQKMNLFLFILPVLCFATFQVSASFQLLYPASNTLVNARYPLLCVSVLVFNFCASVWFYNLWRHYRSSNYRLGFEEKKELIYMFTLWTFSVAFMVAKSFDNPTSNLWADTKEKIILAYCILNIAGSIFLTIVPDQLLRILSFNIQEASLRLKREFVRYVSHEIRSPLNVAFAGLEILKAELEVIGVSNKIRELMEDIHFACNTAIEILNDMLHYEHIDSGTFKLELAVMPLLDAFKGRLSAYRFMASKKNISLLIEDRVGVSEHYERVSDDIELANHLVSEGDDPVHDPMLYIDKFRVEQVIRNLVSNGIKFTPDEGTITLRFMRTAAVPDPSEAKHPVHSLEDDSVVKKIESYLRIEVVDSGAGLSSIFYRYTV
jgi:signal transduction histidine kinase